ncbi:hypothetical protein QUV83_06990 [Cellulomonas cellasea]|uniref:hypothetical protein n=1 Tax=Cellulomonas cellasea TaxID=43670 RepID=UPI0025A4006A|nr:hypothetical protein [Cellulomonas cellasea]MDM8084502.1 hypothetical protein [Cellulomonas cellasea]
MSTPRRVALTVLLTVVLGAAGALGGVAFHWYVVQPSDEELLAASREVDLGGLSPTTTPVITGRWAPSLARGAAEWSASSGDVDSLVDVVDDLEAEGWTVDRVVGQGAMGRVHASRGGVDVGVWLRASDEGGAEATVALARGNAVPSLTVTVVLGAVAGALAGVTLGLAVRRPRGGPGKPASYPTCP